MVHRHNLLMVSMVLRASRGKATIKYVKRSQRVAALRRTVKSDERGQRRQAITLQLDLNTQQSTRALPPQSLRLVGLPHCMTQQRLCGIARRDLLIGDL